MPKQSKTPHPKWNLTLTFNDDAHSYVDSEGHSYTSVTGVVGRYKQPFDALGISQRKAERETPQGAKSDADHRKLVGSKAQALRDEWEKKRNDAAAYGTRVHETAEALILDQAPPHKPRDDRERHAFSLVWEYAQILKRCEDLWMKPEVVVFSPRIGVAGTVDLLCYSESAHCLTLFDWKTNQEIKYSGFRDAAMKCPVDNLPDCNHAHYSLQLGIYEWILAHEGYFAFIPGPVERVQRCLLWVPPYDSGGDAVQPTDCLPIEREVSEMLLHYVTDMPL